MQELTGKIVVITGAGRGLGAAFALSLADRGCELVLCGRHISGLEAVANAVFARTGKRPELISLDLVNIENIGQAIDQIGTLKPRIDVLINNGAMWLGASASPYDDTEVLGVINAALTGTFLLTQGLRPLLVSSDAPDVVIIGSISGLPNAALQGVSVPFYAAKRGQVALADGFRQTFAGTPIRALLINPPYLDDAIPDQPDWDAAVTRQKGQRGTSRDVVEATIFALTRPRHVSLSIEIGTDDGGLFPPPSALA
ncbi:short-chain dehydrogenase [Agrobacterium deltaense]|uniref:SDR family NAD(P)-dependent oxidoreductase n=1 Tax=Agrobacterium TaxID=357 RepID=UPI0007459784|nr:MULTISPECIES: SDR family oxidoreductase [Agrobacterium]KVK54286.1 hypothetical protein L901_18115 [Agrobacterium sp. D14]RKF41781.1 short-chain dehydrogenase [Agrobacterium deltaense]